MWGVSRVPFLWETCALLRRKGSNFSSFIVPMRWEVLESEMGCTVYNSLMVFKLRRRLKGSGRLMKKLRIESLSD